MKKFLNNSKLILGFVFLLVAILLYGLDKHGIIDVAGPPKLLLIVIILSMGFIINAACDVFKTTNKKMQIEANDERNITISKIAKSFGFDVMTSLFCSILILLFLFDLITTDGFFVLFVFFAIIQVSYMFKLTILNNKI